jgi:ribonuclease VapC
VDLMIVDSSAVIAILLREPDAERFARSIANAPICLMSAVTRVELSFVIEGRHGDAGRADLDRFLADAQVEVASIGPEQAEIAIEAFRRYGKGRHRARLNIGDCFAYALAKATDQPLLFKGDDFNHTDLRSALEVSPPT